ncbi:MAG: HYR domain-containing protein, partial [Bacteroidales bacterium]|nr:HYR domain-containing protein [Bacteroidales bacterium]
GLCSASNVALGTPVTDDNCTVADVSNNAPATFPLGNTTVTWTVTDGAGNTAQCTQTVTVDDNENPTITCPDNITVNTDAGLCSASNINLGGAVTDDNCSVADVSNDAPATFQLGATSVIWTVTDGSGNTAQCTQTVTVIDNENPSITCPVDLTVNTDNGVCSASNVALGTPVTDDNCSVADVSNDAPATFPLGNTTVTWTVTDGSGNSAFCTQSVTVIDNENPTIVCPGDITQGADAGVCNAYVNVPPPSTNDNCGVQSVTNSFNGTSNASGEYPVGTTIVTWTVTDISGNSTSCTMSVTVIDSEEPTIECPLDIVQGADPGVCEAYVIVPTPVTSDNCGVQWVTNSYTGSNNASDVYPIGSTTVVWTVIDLSGNTATCSMTVTVIDTEAPTIVCPDNITVNNDPGLCEAFVTVPSPTVWDNCEIQSITNDFNGTADASGDYQVGTTAVEWTVTDVSGNSTSCTMEITVIDNELPAIICPENISQDTDPGVCEAFVFVPEPSIDD